MAVSKRTRFEVLRRDNYTCRYCRSADNELTVDHVTPVALGGSDKPENLVACCKDCNAGKSSSSPEANTVADVSAQAAHYAAGIRDVYEQQVKDLKARRRYINRFVKRWKSFTNSRGYEIDLPHDYAGAVGGWYDTGVPVEILEHAIEVAMSRRNLPSHSVFPYVYGIVRNKTDDARDKVIATQGATEAPEPCKECASWERLVDRKFGYTGALLTAHIDRAETVASATFRYGTSIFKPVHNNLNDPSVIDWCKANGVAV